MLPLSVTLTTNQAPLPNAWPLRFMFWIAASCAAVTFHTFWPGCSVRLTFESVPFQAVTPFWSWSDTVSVSAAICVLSVRYWVNSDGRSNPELLSTDAAGSEELTTMCGEPSPVEPGASMPVVPPEGKTAGEPPILAYIPWSTWRTPVDPEKSTVPATRLVGAVSPGAV
nr:hypothetical protein [Streptomyces sp. 846.5]